MENKSACDSTDHSSGTKLYEEPLYSSLPHTQMKTKRQVLLKNVNEAVKITFLKSQFLSICLFNILNVN